MQEKFRTFRKDVSLEPDGTDDDASNRFSEAFRPRSDDATDDVDSWIEEIFLEPVEKRKYHRPDAERRKQAKRKEKRKGNPASKGHRGVAVLAVVLLFLACAAGGIWFLHPDMQPLTGLRRPLPSLTAYAALPDTGVSANTEPVAASLADRVQLEELYDNLYRLTVEPGSRFVDTEGERYAADVILNKLAAYGYTSESGRVMEQPFRIDIPVEVEIEEDEEEEEPETEGGESTLPPDSGEWTEEEDEEEKPKTKIVHVYYDSRNLIATLPTQRPNPKILVVSCHYDAVWEVQGAVDNASGCAAVLEMARVMAESGRDFGVEVRFIFFSGEELGMYGSKQYIEELTQEDTARHIGQLNIDMAASSCENEQHVFTFATYGKNTSDGYVEGSTDQPAENRMSLAVSRAYSRNPFDMDSCVGPIHWAKNDLKPFHEAGIDAVTLSWREVAPERAIVWDIASPSVMHTQRDTLDNLELTSLSQTARLALAAVEELLAIT